jgi:hypothetical protein
LAAPALGVGISALGITSVGTFIGSGKKQVYIGLAAKTLYPATGAAIVTGLFGVGGGQEIFLPSGN